MRHTKTPAMMRREAERRGKPEPRPLSPPDPSRRPLQGRDPEPEPDLAATAEWLAHIAAGRISVR